MSRVAMPAALVAAALAACGGVSDGDRAPSGAASASASGPSAAGPASAVDPVASARAPAPSAAASADGAGSAVVAASGPACPEGMLPLPGGEVWIGRTRGSGNPEEEPRWRTRLAPFCLDRTEVTVAEYRRCSEAGKCTAPGTAGKFCNDELPGRERHPINCVDWHQAAAHCAFRGVRLPSEEEWEFAARGGSAAQRYPWGDGPPSTANTCWMHAGGSCEVASLPAGAFGLFDITGNVWEWTSSDFGPYPWPPLVGRAKIYRGGSWSRRFEKWMSSTLRNRFAPSERGSHLGFRCASLQRGAECPFGSDGAGGCLRGVLDSDCDPGSSWNGVRCAREGWPRCPDGREERLGFGCVPSADGAAPSAPAADGRAPSDTATAPPSASPPAEPISFARSPSYDGDCARHQPTRPVAYRISGGTHQARNGAGKSRGCSNRDVGVGWNSVCCPS